MGTIEEIFELVFQYRIRIQQLQKQVEERDAEIKRLRSEDDAE